MFARVPRLNRKSDFCAVWFIECQSRVIALDKTTKNFRFLQFLLQPPKTHFQTGREYISSSLTFKMLKLAYYRKLHRFKPNFPQWQRPQDIHRAWSKQAYNKSKMADSRHLEKPKNGRIYTTLWRSCFPICRLVGQVLIPKCVDIFSRGGSVVNLIGFE